VVVEEEVMIVAVAQGVTVLEEQRVVPTCADVVPDQGEEVSVLSVGVRVELEPRSAKSKRLR
jgi:hypothetical protein